MLIEPKKSLGQHFLRSEKALQQIVDSTLVPTLGKGGLGGVVFEIGPGEGVLTEKLLEKFEKVIVVEIDKRSIEVLKEKFGKELESGKLKILEKDCLEVDYEKEVSLLFRGGTKGGAPVKPNPKYILVGNIPYYITGAIFRHTFEQKVLPKKVVFLIQKEVAQRIVATDKKESLLSVSVKIFTDNTNDLKIVDIVKAGSFVPPPKVDSAIISIKPLPTSPFSKGEGEMELFFTILRAAFSHKRKMMLPNLKTDLPTEIYEKYFEKIKEIVLENYTEKVRAEDLSVETWKKVVGIL